MEMKLFLKAALYSSTFSKHTQLCTYESTLILLWGNLLGHVFLRANSSYLVHSIIYCGLGNYSAICKTAREHACSVTESCQIRCNYMDCSLPGSSIHGIFLARILEWVTISSFRGFYQPRGLTGGSWASCTGRQIIFNTEPSGKPLQVSTGAPNSLLFTLHNFPPPIISNLWIISYSLFFPLLAFSEHLYIIYFYQICIK